MSWNLPELEKARLAATRKQAEDDAENARVAREARKFYEERIDRWTKQVSRLELIDAAVCLRTPPEGQDRLTGGIRSRIAMLRRAIGDQRVRYDVHEEAIEAVVAQAEPITVGGGSWADQE